mmetsp:Transcript_34400/g.51883  ORF Transcript_34400/g.51883 Transcript_34400/m.51883 type:complete len:87 (+) Transcript_34400:107-367(+)
MQKMTFARWCKYDDDAVCHFRRRQSRMEQQKNHFEIRGGRGRTERHMKTQTRTDFSVFLVRRHIRSYKMRVSLGPVGSNKKDREKW